jgi:phospholipase C
MTQTRRDFLKAAAALTGAAGFSGVIPGSIQRAFAIAPDPGSTYLDAEHIVILMQENRSFDHALGTLQGVRGFNDPRAVRLANGNSVFVQTDAAGKSYAPWRLDIRDTRITWMGSIPHSRNSQVDAWNGGLQNGWLDAKRSGVAEYAALPLTMGHYTRDDLPFYYALADAFTVCDQHYCSAMTSTSPNRSFFWTGTVRDKQHPDSLVFMRNEEIERGGMIWKTYPERLHEAGISWKFYQNELTRTGGLNDEEQAWLENFGCNLLEYFAAYNVEAYPGAVLSMKEDLASLTKEAAKLQRELAAEKDPQNTLKLRTRLQKVLGEMESITKSLPDSGEALYKTLTGQQRALHDAAFVTNSEDPHYRSLEGIAFESDGKQQEMMAPKGDVLFQFRQDVNEGKLPTISWLSSPERFSDHPTSPWYGAWYVSEVMDILTRNPEVWKKTIFILTYDENDGYFDHAPSFVAADPKRPSTGGASAGIDTGLEYTSLEDELRQGVSKEDARSGPIGMGFRVPMIVASPWSRGGRVNSQLFDHTSTLSFLEHYVQHKHGKTVREENVSAWRRAIAGDLTSIFRPYEAKQSALDYLDRDKFVVSIEQARYKELPRNFVELSAAQIDELNADPLHSHLMAHQEKGVRPSCALPYELYADGSLSTDRTRFELRFKAGNQVHGSLAVGAPFNVYLRNLSDVEKKANGGMIVATYAVKPGDSLAKEFPLSLFADSGYRIEVHGPNGFYRSFTGGPEAGALQSHLAYEIQGKTPTGNVHMHLANPGDAPLSVTVQDVSYKTGAVTRTVAPGESTSLLLELKASHGWYDFSASAKGSETVARYAGRVETGRSSWSDPLMGGLV